MGFEEWYESKYGVLLRSVEAPIGEVSGERYDPQEMFDLMQSDRLETQHPDALAYHKARKTAARDVRNAVVRAPARLFACRQFAQAAVAAEVAAEVARV